MDRPTIRTFEEHDNSRKTLVGGAILMGISLFVNIFYRIYIMTPWAPHCYQVYNRIDVRTPVHCSSFIVEQVGAIVFYIITAFCFLILYNFKTKRRVLGVVRIPKQNGS